MADKINAIKIKQPNGSYSDQIPISVLVQNVQWDQNHSLLDALGSVDLSSSGKGNLQHQIDELDEDKISHDDFNSQLDEFLSEQIKEDTETWLEENINPGEGFGITTNLTLSGWAADAKAVGDAIDAKTFPIDSTLSDSSTNPVQNKVVTSAISELNGSLGSVSNALDEHYNTHLLNYSDGNGWSRGRLDASGNVNPSAVTWIVTDFIEVAQGRKVEYHLGTYVASGFVLAAYYDEDKTFISAEVAPSTHQNDYLSGELTIPSTAKFFRVNAMVSSAEHNNQWITYDTIKSEDNHVEILDRLTKDEEKVTLNPTENLFDYLNDVYTGYTLNLNTGELQNRNNFDVNGICVAQNENIALPKYFPLEPDQTIVCNYDIWGLAYYDSNKEYIGKTSGSSYAYDGNIGIEGCTYARILIQGSSNQTAGRIYSVDDFKNLVVYVEDVAQKKLPAKRWVPAQQIDASYVSRDYLDVIVPSMVDSEFLSAMKCTIIREMNNRDHAYRFSTFNMTVSVGLKGWELIRRMLMDCGIDFCGFNELTHQYNNDITEFLKGWQFPYGFNDISDETAPSRKAFVSRYEVISGERLFCPSASSNAEYIVCKVQLPRYLDIYNPFRTLSVYVIHFPITVTSNKIAVANDILAKIATDTSDFIVIMGDTNDFSDLESGKTFWRTLEAGGFRPTIPIDTKTVTMDDIGQESDEYPEKQWRHNSIDQFLVSDNIDVVSYNVINTKDVYNDPPCLVNGATNNMPALSDHDFVYVDLKFKYDTPRIGLRE